MKSAFTIFITAVVSIFVANYIVLAFTEPTSPPPAGNVSAPINVGGGRQVKNGDLTVQNLKASSITLGEDTRVAWPGGVGGGACAWSGTKCSCKNVTTESGGIFGLGSSNETLRVVVGATCLGGVLTNIGVVNFGSSGCPNPTSSRTTQRLVAWGCDPALYTR